MSEASLSTEELLKRDCVKVSTPVCMQNELVWAPLESTSVLSQSLSDELSAMLRTIICQQRQISQQVEFSMCDSSARMHCLAQRRSKIGQTVTGKYAKRCARALQTCGKLLQRATPRAFVWFAARPESSEQTRASLSPRFPPCATEPSDESYVASSGQ
ncbi:hypothetical protein HPB50_019007 [Hyalomma asiaticum]|uniref:Uncharacterized protein n=1 Tax=Hyalomma asiaticum TaxID=266040 RepID=A0ACB7RVL4_HYAAI|nr:hypothetical protein HPB50_019007 [Hyalomma asiaticum]